MRITITILGVALMLAGCVHNPPKTAVPKHHYVAKSAPKPAAVTPVPAPAPQVAPAPKQTFKQRWLRKFFRNRAEQ